MTPFLIGPGSTRYSSIRASNGKYIIIQGEHGFNVLYSIAGSPLRTLPAAMSHSSQAVFSRTDPDTIYYCADNRLMRYDCIQSASVVEKVFSEYTELVSEHAEGDISEDGEHLALCGRTPNGNEEVLIYSLVSHSVIKTYPLVKPFDGLKISGDRPILSDEFGIWDLRDASRLAPVNGHACIGSDAGRPVLLWCTSADRQVNSNTVKLIDIETGESRILETFDWDFAMQLTAGLDCVFVGVYDPKGERHSAILRVPFNGSAVKVLHEWKSAYRGYQSSPRPTHDNGLLLFTVDDGNQEKVFGLKVDEKPIEKPVFIEYAPGKEYPIVTQPKCPTCGSTIAGIRESA